MRCPNGSRRSAGRFAHWFTRLIPVEETIKGTVQPYFVLEGNTCALLAA